MTTAKRAPALALLPLAPAAAAAGALFFARGGCEAPGDGIIMAAFFPIKTQTPRVVCGGQGSWFSTHAAHGWGTELVPTQQKRMGTRPILSLVKNSIERGRGLSVC